MPPRKKSKSVQSHEVIRKSCDLNRQMSDTQQVPSIYGVHYVNLRTGELGLRGLIRDIFKSAGAVLPSGTEISDRQKAIGSSLLTAKIQDEVWMRFTRQTNRYPISSVKACLDVMLDAGEVGKIQLKGKEDILRDSPRPRCKWYLCKDWLN